MKKAFERLIKIIQNIVFRQIQMYELFGKTGCSKKKKKQRKEKSSSKHWKTIKGSFVYI